MKLEVMVEDFTSKTDPPYKNKNSIMILRKMIGQVPLLNCVSEKVTWIAPSTIPGCVLANADIP